jgi:hypothetical protein
MDNATQQTLVYLVVFALPMSMACFVFGILSAGFLRNQADQPGWFRCFSRRMPPTRNEGPVPMGIAVAVLGAALFNFAPIAILVLRPGSLQSLIVVVYFVVEGAWLASLWRAIGRAGTHDRTK